MIKGRVRRGSAGGLLAMTAVTVTALAGCSSAGHPAGIPHSSGASGASLAAFVVDAAQRSLAEKTADMTLSGSVSVTGQSVPLHGTGQANFTTMATRLSLATAFSGKSVTVQEEFVGGKIYIGLDIAGHSLKQLTGYDWFAVQVSTNDTSFLSSNPMAALTELEQKGASVRSLGTSTIDGTAVQGYAATPSKDGMLSSMRTSPAFKQLPASGQAAALRTLEQSPPPTISVWFDQQRHLVRRFTADLTLNGLAASGVSASGSVTLDFTNYGAPVTITAPPAGDVMSQQKMQQLEQASGS